MSNGNDFRFELERGAIPTFEIPTTPYLTIPPLRFPLGVNVGNHPPETTVRRFGSGNYQNGAQGPKALQNYVHHLARHNDHLAGCVALEQSDDLLVGQRNLFDSLAIGIRRDADAATNLAVDLDRVLDGILDEPLLLDCREGSVRKGFRVTQTRPQLFREVRREGSEHQHDSLD